MQLLTVGKTIKGTREGPNSFRMNEQTLLPKFSSPRRQSAPETAQPPETCAAMATGSLFESRQSRAADPAVPAKAIETAAASIVRSSQPPTKAPAQKPRWSLFQRLFGRKPARDTFGVPVQTEWKLEKVTVIRNDLSDSDLELIPAGHEPAGLPEPPAKTQEPSPQPDATFRAKRGWARVSSRIFKSSQTQ
jgi:hypothetical protein